MQHPTDPQQRWCAFADAANARYGVTFVATAEVESLRQSFELPDWLEHLFGFGYPAAPIKIGHRMLFPAVADLLADYGSLGSWPRNWFPLELLNCDASNPVAMIRSDVVDGVWSYQQSLGTNQAVHAIEYETFDDFIEALTAYVLDVRSTDCVDLAFYDNRDHRLACHFIRNGAYIQLVSHLLEAPTRRLITFAGLLTQAAVADAFRNESKRLRRVMTISAMLIALAVFFNIWIGSMRGLWFSLGTLPIVTLLGAGDSWLRVRKRFRKFNQEIDAPGLSTDTSCSRKP